MTLLSFIIPTDKDILRDLNENSRSIKFIGLGDFSQKINEIKFSRTFSYRFDKEKTLKQVIYFKQGLVWQFEGVVSLQEKSISK
ncbi:MAG: hypothetical protein COA67_03570 [Lutibacter sp.]|nr:MAG: hypothetical protein COA67_03570 [Lutibacter sp.]